jgi:hypothetical protein
MNIRGERYHVHERQALEDVISPHSDVLYDCLGRQPNACFRPDQCFTN